VTLYLQNWLSYFVKQYRTFKKKNSNKIIMNLKKEIFFYFLFFILSNRLEFMRKMKINKEILCFDIFVNLNLDVIDQEVENETVKNHIENDDIDQVCFDLKISNQNYFLLASSHSDHGSRYNSNRKRSHRSHEDSSRSNHIDKTMSHIMANGVR
jgi:hypothetical protein